MEGRKVLTEGFGPIVGGVHGGLHPSLLQENQYAQGLNVSTRGGYVSTRPGFKKVLDLGTDFFQGAERYRLNEGDRLIFVQAGKIKQIKLFEPELNVVEYEVEPTTYTKLIGDEEGFPETTYTQSISPEFGKNDDGNWSSFVNMVKAERFFIVQDGFHQPVIIGDRYDYDPDKARVSFQSPFGFPGSSSEFESTEFFYSEVPIGVAMSFASRRLCVSPRYQWEDLTGVYVPDPPSGRMTFVVSDLDVDPESCLRFTETNFAGTGGALSLPFESGFITAMAPFRNAEALDGNGALVVFGQEAISAFNLAFDRDSWGSSKQLISRMLFQDIGCYSPRAVIPVNNDLYFRRVDGLASLRYTENQTSSQSGALSVTPQSFEVSHRLNLDDFKDLPKVSMESSDNRIFVTSGGLTPGGLGFRGLLVLDNASLFSMQAPPYPIFDDIWTGLDFLDLVSARYQEKDRLFVFGKCNGSLGLYMLDEQDRNDDGTPIFSRFYTRQYPFGSAGTKKFSKCELWIRDLIGEAEITLYWRADGYYLWKKCNVVHVNSDTSGLPQARYRITLGPLEENPCDEATGRPLRAGTAFQFCLEWRGSLKIEKALFFADAETATEPRVQCDEEVAVALVESEESGQVLDDFVYSSCG